MEPAAAATRALRTIRRGLYPPDGFRRPDRDDCDPFSRWRSVGDEAFAGTFSMSRKHAIALLWVLVMAGGMWLSATQVAIHSELADLLPEGTTATQRLLLNQARSGLAGRLLLLAVEGGNVDALAEASREFSEQLRASGRFTLVENGAQSLLQQRGGIVFESRYLLSPMVGPDAFSRES